MQRFLRTLALMAFMLMPWATRAQNSITVAEGTASNEYVPVYGFYVDEFLRSQTIYPASMIGEAAESVSMTGGSISSMTFYLSSPASGNWGSATFAVKLTEVSATTLSGWQDVSSATTVYEGALDPTQSTMTIEFSTPYTYNGGNLLLEISSLTEGSYKRAYFAGTESSAASWQGYNSSSVAAISGSVRNFIPKATFNFSGGQPITCKAVSNLVASDITSSGVTLTWEDANNSGASYSIYNGDQLLGTVAAGTYTYTVTGLESNTVYSLSVVANCSASDASFARIVTFRTACGMISALPYTNDFENAPAYSYGSGVSQAEALPFCWSRISANNSPYVYNTYSSYSGNNSIYLTTVSGDSKYLVMPQLDVASIPTNTVMVSFYANKGGNPVLEVGTMSDPADASTFVPVQTVALQNNYNLYTVRLTSAPATNAYIAFRGSYGTTYGNFYIDDVTLEEMPSCWPVSALAVDTLTYNSVTLSWEGDVDNPSTTTYTIYNGENVVSTNATSPFVVEGLTPETEYTFTVVANCAADDASKGDSIVATTNPSCWPATNLVAERSSYTEATLTWDASENNLSTVAFNVYKNDELLSENVVSPFVVNGLQVDSVYTFKVIANCGADDLSAATEVVYTHGYCVPNATDVDNDGILNVSFGSFTMVDNNDHISDDLCYGNYYNQVGSIIEGTDTFEVSITYSTGYTYNTVIWIDWNHDLVFSNDEIVSTGSTSGARPVTLKAKVALPDTASGYYRMRIAGADKYFDNLESRLESSTEPISCFDTNYAIAEDYTLFVGPAPEQTVSFAYLTTEDGVDMGTAATDVATIHWGDSIVLNSTPATNMRTAAWYPGNLTSVEGVEPIAIDTNSLKVRVTSDTTFTVVYGYGQFEIKGVLANANQEHMGSVAGNSPYNNNMYDYATEAILTATPSTGFNFIEWRNEDGSVFSTENPLKLEAYQSYTLTAHFAIASYEVSFEGENGTVEGVGTYTFGSSATLTAVPNEHYQFVRWADDDNTNATRSYRVITDSVFHPVFEPIVYTVAVNGPAEIATYTVKDAEGNDATEFAYTKEATVAARDIDTHYTFVNWVVRNNVEQIVLDENGDTVYDAEGNATYQTVVKEDTLSTENPYTFAVDANITLIPMFSAEEMTVTIASNDNDMGSVNFVDHEGTSVTVNYLDEVKMSAQTVGDYSHFDGWYNGEEFVSMDNPYTYVVNQPATLTAHFSFQEYGVSVSAEPAEAGVVSASDFTPQFSDNVVFTASANDHWVFDHWTYKGQEASLGTDTAYSEMIFEPTDLVAHFVRDTHAIVAVVVDETHGTVSVTDSNAAVAAAFVHGSKATVSFEAGYGYTFDGWKNQNDVLVSMENPYTFEVTEDDTLTATVKALPFTVKVDVVADEDGYARGAAYISENDASFTFDYLTEINAQLTAVPTYGFEFSCWTNANGDTIVLPMVLNQDTMVYANFNKLQYEIKATVAEDCRMMGRVSGNDNVGYLETVTLTATANTGYHFAKWVDAEGNDITDLDGNVVIAENTFNDFVSNIDYPIYVANGNTLTVLADTAHTVTAVFDYNAYTVEALSNDNNMGTVNITPASAPYLYSQTITLTPAAAKHYHFVNWKDDNTDNPRTFILTGDTTFAANFAIDTHTVTLSYDEAMVEAIAVTSVNGTTFDTNRFVYNDLVRASITPAYGYTFEGWSFDGMTPVANTTDYDFNLTQDTTLVPLFSTIQYTVSVTAGAHGSATVNDADSVTVDYRTPVTLKATADYGYDFVEWKDVIADSVLSTAVEYTHTVTADAQIAASFTEHSYVITAQVNDDAMGTIAFNTSAAATSDDALVKYNNEVTIKATPNEHYDFVDWTNAAGDHFAGVTDAQGVNTLTVTVTADETYTANFKKEQYTITVASADELQGTVIIEGADKDTTVEYNEHISLVATAVDENHRFLYWSNAAGDHITDNPLDLAVSQTDTYTATFGYQVFLLTAVSEDSNKGGVYVSTTSVSPAPSLASKDTSVDYNTAVNIYATPAEHYHFTAWKNAAGDTVSKNSTESITVLGDSTLTASFEGDGMPMIYQVNNAIRGAIEGPDTAEFNTEITIKAVPAHGYEFTQWEDDSTLAAERTVTVKGTDAENTYKAIFDFQKYELNVTVENGTVSVTNDVTDVNDSLYTAVNSINANYFYGSVIDLTFTANEHYHFVVDGNNVTSFVKTVNLLEAPEAINYVAVIDEQNVTVATADATMGTVTVNGVEGDYNAILPYGTEINLSVTPVEHYHFVKWSDGVTDSVRTDTVLAEDINLTAIFAIDIYNVQALVAEGQAERGTASVQGMTYSNVNIAIHAHDSWGDDWGDASKISLMKNGVEIDSYNKTNGSFYTRIHDDEGTMTTIADAEMTLVWTPSSSGNDNQEISFEIDINGERVFETTDAYYLTSGQVLATIPVSGGFLPGSTAEFTATANDGYVFASWNDGDTAATRNLTINSDTTLTASFDFIGYTVNVSSNNDVMGTASVDPDQEFYHVNDTIVITATPEYGYYFVNWSDGNTDSVRTIVMTTASIELVANFEFLNFDLVARSDNDERGTVTGAGNYPFGTQVEISAVANDGFIFTSWNDGVTNATRTVTVDGQTEYIASFRTDALYTVTVNAEHGQVTGAGSNFIENDLVTLNAVPATGYRFDNYTDAAGNVLSATSTFSFNIVSDTVINANFSANKYTVTLAVNDEAMGTVAGAGEYDFGTEISISATANANYSFLRWSDDVTESTRTIVVTNDTTFTAIFQAVDVNVVAEAVNGTVEGAGSYAAGDQVTLTATANPCFTFAGWSNGSTENPLTFTATVDTTFTATFEPLVFASESTVAACTNYQWNGQTLTESGDYVDTLSTAAGCDSIVTLHLTVNQPVTVALTESACGSYEWNEQTLTESGEYIDTALAANGCDSITTLTLTINQPVTVALTESACGSYEWNGQTLTESGEYIDTALAANGCDSITTLTLTINQPASASIAETVCGSYEWNGQTLTESGEYLDTVVAANGCDSIITLTLTINEAPVVTLTATACGSYEWNGQTLTESGEYSDTTVALNGCDSITTLTLTIAQPQTDTLTVTACDTYEWNNNVYTESGVYTDSAVSIYGCDSISVLNLTINLSTTTTEQVTANGPYVWNGTTYSESGEYTDTTIAANGCDSIAILQLTINAGHTVTIAVNNANMGSTTPAVGTYSVAHEGEFTVTATPANDGYRFVRWSNGVTEATMTLTVVSDTTVTAIFDSIMYTIQASANDSTMGFVVGQGIYRANTLVTLEAYANDGYRFVRWSNGETNAHIEFLATEDITLTAIFEADPTGIDDVEGTDAQIYSYDSKIIVKGAENLSVFVFDVNGRCLRTVAKAGETVEFDSFTSGVYLVKVGNAPAKRVLVVR